MGPFFSFWAQQGAARGQTYVPKGGQDGTQNATLNGPKSKTKTKTKKGTLYDRLRAILEPSWADLGAHLGAKKCVFLRFFNDF